MNFTLTPDNLILLLNDEPILPRAHPHIPTPLRAPLQSSLTPLDVIRTDVTEAVVMDLDYYIQQPDTTASTSFYNRQYSPGFLLDILRAGMPNNPGYNIPLNSTQQNRIYVFLEDLSDHPLNTPFTDIPLRIKGVELERRWPVETIGRTTYKTLKSLKTCHIWSWLCAENDSYPYYEYIYRVNFDQFGKKGSMRHFLTARWAELVGLIGARQAIVGLAALGCVMLLLVVTAVWRGGKRGVNRVVGTYRMRIQEVDEWVADEEVEGLLEGDRYLDDFGKVEEETVQRETPEKKNGGERTSIEEYLPPPPYQIPIETEKC